MIYYNSIKKVSLYALIFSKNKDTLDIVIETKKYNKNLKKQKEMNSLC